MMDAIKLQQQLRLPEFQELSDADAAVKLSTPDYVPRTERVTATTIADAIGINEAVTLRAKLRGAQAAGDPTSDYVLGMLDGPGFDAANPKAAPVAQGFVAAGIATANQVRDIFNVAVYCCDGLVTEDDVIAVRGENAKNDRIVTLRGFIANGTMGASVLVDQFAMGLGGEPSLDDLVSAFKASVTK